VKSLTRLIPMNLRLQTFVLTGMPLQHREANNLRGAHHALQLLECGTHLSRACEQNPRRRKLR
jgi:hypothetical protein